MGCVFPRSQANPVPRSSTPASRWPAASLVAFQPIAEGSATAVGGVSTVGPVPRDGRARAACASRTSASPSLAIARAPFPTAGESGTGAAARSTAPVRNRPGLAWAVCATPRRLGVCRFQDVRLQGAVNIVVGSSEMAVVAFSTVLAPAPRRTSSARTRFAWIHAPLFHRLGHHRLQPCRHRHLRLHARHPRLRLCSPEPWFAFNV